MIISFLLFSNLNNEDENTKILLYVACSRARKIKDFYLDDITSFKDGIGIYIWKCIKL